jgi:predicted enzyme related to lactoylglutathione lyase
MSQNTLVWTDIPVVDLHRAVAFYSKVLNEPTTLQKGDACEFGLLPHTGTNASGCLVVSSDSKPSSNGTLIYLSANGRLDDAVRAVAENGGKVLDPKHAIGPYGFRAIVLDSEGNRIALHSETA